MATRYKVKRAIPNTSRESAIPPFDIDLGVTVRFVKSRTGLPSSEIARRLGIDSRLVRRAIAGQWDSRPGFFPTMPSNEQNRKARSLMFAFAKDHVSDTRPNRRDGLPIFSDPAEAIRRRENAPSFEIVGLGDGRIRDQVTGKTYDSDSDWMAPILKDARKRQRALM